MKLSTYKNLYAYFISYNPSKGNEINLEYNRKSGIYTVSYIVNWNVTSSFRETCPVDAKNTFRDMVKISKLTKV